MAPFEGGMSADMGDADERERLDDIALHDDYGKEEGYCRSLCTSYEDVREADTALCMSIGVHPEMRAPSYQAT